MKTTPKCKIFGALLLSLSMASATSCGKQAELAIPTYEKQELMLSGFWAPYELTDETFETYKNCGLNTMTLNGHSLAWDSEHQFYLGSKRTEKGLALCKKNGLNAIIGYNDWIASGCGEPYGTTPFSSLDYYGEYKDIILGFDIVDEPNIEKLKTYGATDFIDDFKATYNTEYRVNLFPSYVQPEGMGCKSYAEYLEVFEENILKKTAESPFVSVDFYPFRPNGEFYTGWLNCYEKVARLAKKYSATEHFYIQTAVSNEFRSELTEEDIRLQLYVAMCFGGSQFTYYCYENPKSGDSYLYDYCLLQKDGTPSVLYDYVTNINNEIQSFSSAFLAYHWKKTVGISGDGSGYGDPAIRIMNEKKDFSDCRYLASVETDGNCIIGCFENSDGEAYMAVNYGDPETTEAIDILFSYDDCRGVCVYGGTDYSQGPTIVALKNGKCTISLKPGEGKWIVPLS